MATKKDFTAADKSRYSGIIGGADISNTKDITDTKDTTNISNARKYHKIDPLQAAPAEYRFTARMPGECGRFLAELAYQRRSTITAEIQRLIEEEMERRPEILKNLDELND